VVDSVINYLDKFGPEVLVIQFGILVIITTLFLWLWFANRRKYHNLKHAIPANVVKSYLDTIIQNSTALKSQLFRGGGLDVGGVPSVMPLHGLMGGDSVGISGAPSTALLEELNQKKAFIASLEAQLGTAQASQKEFESKLGQSQKNLQSADARIKELEARLAEGGMSEPSSGGGDEALRGELATVTRDRDDLRDRLKEFEIIADDLANLKRLQQENEQLKRSLAAQGGSLPPMEESAPEPSDDVTDILGDGLAEEPQASGNALEDFLAESETPVEAAAEPENDKPKSDKTPEDLLSEFEKMLG
jgi:predicted  nucleic acid-binding Zn-ribbon protein